MSGRRSGSGTQAEDESRDAQHADDRGERDPQA
jgi:hypothetical protein